MFFRATAKLMRSKEWQLVPTDKDGGYALCTTELLTTVHHNIFRNGDYVYGTPSERTHSEYKSICKKWANHLDLPNLYGNLLTSLSIGAKTAILKLTCKTHKAELDFRNLHACP